MNKVQAGEITIGVPGTASIWLAAEPDGTTVGPFDDVAPTNSPILVNLNSFSTSALRFDVSGQTSRDPNLVLFPLVGGDGEQLGTGPNAQPVWTPSFTPGKVSSMTGPTESLVGVFMNSGTLQAIPSALDFSTVASQGFTDLFPAIQQTFFIGDGLTGTGAGGLQTFYIPSGADTLYLGLSDDGNNNNVGQLNLIISDAAAVPEPSSIILFGIGGIALVGYGVRRKRQQAA